MVDSSVVPVVLCFTLCEVSTIFTSVAVVPCVTPNEVVSGGGDVTCVSIVCTSVAVVLCVTPNEVVSGGGDVTCVSIVCTSVAVVLCVTPNEVFSGGGDIKCVVSTVEIKCVLSVWGTEIFVVGR